VVGPAEDVVYVRDDERDEELGLDTFVKRDGEDRFITFPKAPLERRRDCSWSGIRSLYNERSFVGENAAIVPRT